MLCNRISFYARRRVSFEGLSPERELTLVVVSDSARQPGSPCRLDMTDRMFDSDGNIYRENSPRIKLLDS